MVLELPYKIPQLFKHKASEIEVLTGINNPGYLSVTTIFKDYFSGVALNSAIWTEQIQFTGTITVGSGEVRLRTGLTSASIAGIIGKTYYNLEEDYLIIWEARCKSDANAGHAGCSWGFKDSTGDIYINFVSSSTTTIDAHTNIVTESGEESFNYSISLDTTTYHDYKIIMVRNLIEWFIDGHLIATLERGQEGFQTDAVLKKIANRMTIQNLDATDCSIYSTSTKIGIQ